MVKVLKYYTHLHPVASSVCSRWEDSPYDITGSCAISSSFDPQLNNVGRSGGEHGKESSETTSSAASVFYVCLIEGDLFSEALRLAVPGKLHSAH